MYIRIIQIENEIEFLKVKELLEFNEIPVLTNQVGNAALPFLNDQVYYLSIPEEFSGKYFKIVEGVYPNKVVEIGRKVKNLNIKFWLFIITGYAVIMTLLFIKYFDMDRKKSATKNFDYQWSVDNQELTIVNKASKMPVATHIDKNYDLNYEKTLGYSHGKIVSESIDKDENGIYEETSFFDLKGNLVSKVFDEDQDGLNEKLMIITEDQEKILFEDKNKNGVYEPGVKF